MWAKLSNLKLSTIIILQTSVILLLFSIMSISLGWKTKDKIYDEKTTTTKHLVEIVYTLLTEYDDRINRGEFSLEEG